MKTPDEIKPNYAPVYAAAMYPELAGIFQRHGYALAVHGSLARDFELIAVPWADTVADKETVLKAVESFYAVNVLRDFQQKNHGRVAYTLCVGFGHCSIDLSFLPAAPAPTREPLTAIPIPDRPGYVHSPYVIDADAVDVRGFCCGQKVCCPHTQKTFLVP